MIAYDENKNDVTEENLSFFGDIAYQINKIVNEQNFRRRNILMKELGILSIIIDLFLIQMIKDEVITNKLVSFLPLIACTAALLITHILDWFIVLFIRKKQIEKIEEEINCYLNNKGVSKTIRLMNLRLISHMLLVTRCEDFSVMLEFKDIKKEG